MTATNKRLIIVSGVGDTLVGPNSQRKIKNAEEFKAKVENALATLTQATDGFVGVMDMKYASDSNRFVRLYRDIPKTRLVDMRLNVRSVLNKENEMRIQTIDGSRPVSMKGNDFTFMFRPQDFEIVIMGIDLHGMLLEFITTLLDQGYTVKVVKDALNTFSPSFHAMRELQGKYKSQFTLAPAEYIAKH